MYTEQTFIAKYIFDRNVKLKKKLNLPLQVHECFHFQDLASNWREFYEKLSTELEKDFKLDPEKFLPF